MKPIELIATDLFEKVRSRFTNLQIGDERGSVTVDPAAGRFFDFDFAVEGNTLGRVSISINEIGNLKIFYSQGIMENADSITQTMWYDFLKEMRYFAKRRLLRFDTRDITKGNLDKTDFQYLAQNGNKDPNMNESKITGTGSMTSHRKLENTDLIIRHKDKIDPTQPGARSRKIKNLFIQNAEGERFKFPFVYLPGARAMQRHVANGGYPHDDAGKAIVKTCEEILQLSDFGKKVRRPSLHLNDSAGEIIERATQKLQKLRHHMECMGKQGYYESWKESYAPESAEELMLDAATMESYKDTFTVNNFDEALASVFPLLHSIMQEAGEIDLEAVVVEGQDEEIEIASEDTESSLEFAAFESWAEALETGTLEPETLAKLKDFLESNPGQTLGADGADGAGALRGLGIQDKSLEKLIDAKIAGQDGSNIELADVVKEWLLQNDPAAAQDLFPEPQQAQQPVPQQQAAPAPEAGAEVPQPEMAEDRDMKIEGIKDKISKLTAAFGAKKKSPTTVPEKGFPDVADKDAKMKRLNQRGPDYSESVSEGSEYQDLGPSGREIYNKVQGLRDKIRSGKISVNDELADKFLQLLTTAGLESEFAEKEWNRVTGKKDEPIVDPMHRIASPDSDAKFISDLKQKTGYDSDVHDISNQIAKHGSFKSGDSGHLDYEDSLDPEVDPDSQLIEPDAEEEAPKTGTPEEIRKAVIGFIDKDKGTWTKGRIGIVAHCAREFGEEGGKEAAKQIIELSLEYPMRDNEEDTEQHQHDIAEMRRLAGMSVTEADTWKKETPWKKIPKNKEGKPVDPRGEVTNLSGKARKETEKAEKETKKK